MTDADVTAMNSVLNAAVDAIITLPARDAADVWCKVVVALTGDDPEPRSHADRPRPQDGAEISRAGPRDARLWPARVGGAAGRTFSLLSCRPPSCLPGAFGAQAAS
jgi:hypothetical protein